MEQRLTEFIGLLRNQGLPVSPAESIDALQAVALCGYQEASILHDALATTLVKSAQDLPLFQRCFEQYFQFSRWQSPPGETAGVSLPRYGQGDTPGSGGGGLQPSSALGQLLSGEDSQRLEMSLAQAIQQAGLANIQVLTQQGLYSRRIMMAMGLESLEDEIQTRTNAGNPQSLALAQSLRQARDRLRAVVRQQVESYYLLARRDLRDATLRQVDLAALREMQQAKKLVQRMAKKLISQHSRRRQLTKRGHLDLRATLRHNAGYDGVLMDLKWRRQRIDRPKIIAVCDVSRSVQVYARFLLLFLYSLREVLPRVETYVFSSRLHDVSPLFTALPLEEASDEVMSRYGFGSTDYGSAWRDLWDVAGSQIDKRTTLLILGDARNNRGDPELARFAEMTQRARTVVWINPESRSRWGSGDSEMLRYLPRIHMAASCRTLADLEKLVHRLLIRAS